MTGRSVRLFLIDGTPQGMRTAEVGNWSGLALVCPRTDLARLGARAEVRRTGVYFLVGPSDSSPSSLAVYVGESDDVWARLATHERQEEFWTWVVVFVSKDDNLTKAHARWLEGTPFRELDQARRAEVVNSNEPASGRLPEADTFDMGSYLDNVRLLLPTLGVNVFAIAGGGGPVPAAELRLELKWEDARAECEIVDGQFIVQPGSTARGVEVESLGTWVRTLRSTLRENGVLISLAIGLLRFSQAYAFESPSAAAGVVSGTGLNGRAAWKVKGTGESYKEWLAKQVNGASEKPRAS
jgi:hypothetical protein